MGALFAPPLVAYIKGFINEARERCLWIQGGLLGQSSCRGGFLSKDVKLGADELIGRTRLFDRDKLRRMKFVVLERHLSTLCGSFKQSARLLRAAYF